MTPPRTCARYQSEKIMFPVRFNNHIHEIYAQPGLYLTSPKEPDAWFQLPDVTTYPMVAAVCGACGFVEQHIVAPDDAWAKWQKGYR